MQNSLHPLLARLALVSLLTPIPAFADGTNEWEIGVVLDAAHTSKELELGARSKDLELGHSDR